jgi:hypothetical protein
MMPKAHAPTHPRPSRVHRDDGSSATSILTALAGICVLLVTSLAVIAFAVSRRVAGLNIGWRPSPTVVWALAGAVMAVLVGAAIFAAVVFPDRPRAIADDADLC